MVLCIRWPKYCSSFSFSISPSNVYSGLISLRIDWFDILAVQGTLKSLLQHHNLKASILQHSSFFIVQFSHPYMTTGKTIALTIQTFESKVMSLLFNTLSRFVIAFLPSSKHLLISWCSHHPQWHIVCIYLFGNINTSVLLAVENFLYFYYLIWPRNLVMCLGSETLKWMNENLNASLTDHQTTMRCWYSNNLRWEKK